MAGIIDTRKTKRSFSDEQLAEAVADSRSQADVLRKLGLCPSGANYTQLKHYIREKSLDTSHFSGQSWSKGMTNRPSNAKVELEDIFSGAVVYKAYHYLKLRLIKEGYLIRKCYKCGNTEWMGEPIPIELEHINGNHFDNSLSNLTLLCPNCHAQTSTHAGKNKNKNQ